MKIRMYLTLKLILQTLATISREAPSDTRLASGILGHQILNSATLSSRHLNKTASIRHNH